MDAAINVFFAKSQMVFCQVTTQSEDSGYRFIFAGLAAPNNLHVRPSSFFTMAPKKLMLKQGRRSAREHLRIELFWALYIELIASGAPHRTSRKEPAHGLRRGNSSDESNST